MDALFRSLPRGLIAFLAIAVGFAFIMLNDPPKTACDAQLVLFKAAQQNFLFTSTKNNVNRPADIKELLETCRSANSPGGCHELFERINRMSSDLDDVPSSCGAEVGRIEEIKTALWASLQLMAELAWGDMPPMGYEQRFGWLNSSDVALFCALKKNAIKVFGQDAFNDFQNSMMTELPLASTMTRDQVWDRTLLSARCAAFK